MRNIKVVDFTYGRRSSDDVNTSLPFTDNYKESKTIQQANVVIASYINENIKDIGEINNNIDDLVVEVESKQDELVSGENIKTINGESILGSGDISVVSDVSWGDITGDMNDQLDLKNALADKQDELISGENIKTINGETILGDGNIDVQSTITGGATTITGNNLTANRTLISDSNGKVAVSSVTTTDLIRMKNDNIYSTEEHIVGVWIDGKTIYRKTVVLTSGWNIGAETLLSHGITNFSQIIKYEGIAIRVDGQNQVIPIYFGQSQWILSVFDISATQFRLYVGSSFTGNQALTKLYVTFYYTKTT